MQKQKKISNRILSLVIAVCVVMNMFIALVVDDKTQMVAVAAGYDFDTSDFPEYAITDSLNETIKAINETATAQEKGKGKIKLNGDCAENIIIPDNTALLLDLNGHALKPGTEINENNISNIIVYGMLKIIDSSPNGEGKLESDGTTDVRGIRVANKGKLVFAGGTVNNYYSSQSGAGIIVEENGFLSFQRGTVTNCKSTASGGGISVNNSKNAELLGGAVTNNQAQNGGGVYIYRVSKYTDEITVQDITVSNNTATGNGGGIYVKYPATLALKNIHIDNNTAQNGGGIYFWNYATLTLDNSSVDGNTATTGNGGGIYYSVNTAVKSGSTLKTTNQSSISKNTATTGSGGGVFFKNTDTQDINIVEIKDTQLNENTAGGNYGGAMYIYTKTKVTLTDSEVNQNQAGRHGGGIYFYGTGTGDYCSTFTMTNTDICENKLTDMTTSDRKGGGVFFNQNILITLNSGKINQNQDAVNGGGIYTSSCEVTMDDGMEVSENVISCNFANVQTQGFGMYLYSTNLTMNGGKVESNTYSKVLGNTHGGGIWTQLGSVTITGGSVSKNTIGNGNGGGICVNNASYVAIGGNALIEENRGKSNVYGGGVYVANTTKVTLYGDAVIKNNKGSFGGGVYVGSSNLYFDKMGNVQIINNTATSDGGGLFATCGENYIVDMAAGKINNNTAARNGGGIYISALQNTSKTPEKLFHFTGGEVCGNTANNGGGIFLDRNGGNGSDGKPRSGSTFEFSDSFLVENNTAKNAGGGIYAGDAARVEIRNGAKIIGNTAATYGGGIAKNSQSSIKRDYVNGKDGKTAEDENIEIYGGELHDNTAAYGMDLYVGEAAVDKNLWTRPYFSAVKASQMDNASAHAYWQEEYTSNKITDTLTNKTKLGDGNGATQTPAYSAYVFNDNNSISAKIGNAEYRTVQEAVDAIQDGTAPNGDILLVKSHRETVTIPNGVNATLDLNGLSLYGEFTTAVTVEEGAAFTLKDTSADKSGKLSGGKGTAMTFATLHDSEQKYGGGILCYGTLNIEGATVSGNSARVGSAIAVFNGHLTLKDSTIENNTVLNNNWEYESTVFLFNTPSDISNVTITNNQGVSIFCFGNSSGSPAVVNIRNTKIKNNSSAYVTSVRRGTGTTVYIEDCEFTDNTATSTSYGTVSNTSITNGKLYIKNTLIKNNTHRNSAGVYNGGYT